MSFSDFLANLRRYDENAAVIFDGEEPVGRATDLVMPRRRWFGRRLTKSVSQSRAAAPAAPNEQ